MPMISVPRAAGCVRANECEVRELAACARTATASNRKAPLSVRRNAAVPYPVVCTMLFQSKTRGALELPVTRQPDATEQLGRMLQLASARGHTGRVRRHQARRAGGLRAGVPSGLRRWQALSADTMKKPVELSARATRKVLFSMRTRMKPPPRAGDSWISADW
jgi:hypothetical protein